MRVNILQIKTFKLARFFKIKIKCFFLNFANYEI